MDLTGFESLICLTSILAPGSFPGNLLWKKPMKKRCTELTRASLAHRGRGEKGGQVGHHGCRSQTAMGVSKEMEMIGQVRAVWEGGFLCRPLLLWKDVLSWGTKHEKRGSIPQAREVGSVLPARATSLAGTQPFLRNGKHPWTDPGRSEPIPLTSFSKNYQTWSNHIPSL